MKKQQKYIISIAVVLLIIALAFFLVQRKTETPTETPNISQTNALNSIDKIPEVSSIANEFMSICDTSNNEFNSECKSIAKSIINDKIVSNIEEDPLGCNSLNTSEEKIKCYKMYLAIPRRYGDMCTIDYKDEDIISDPRFKEDEQVKFSEMFTSFKDRNARVYMVKSLEERNPEWCNCITDSIIRIACKEMDGNLGLSLFEIRARIETTKESVKYCQMMMDFFNMSKTDDNVVSCIKHVSKFTSDTKICENYYGNTNLGIECAVNTLKHVPSSNWNDKEVVVEPKCDLTDNKIYSEKCKEAVDKDKESVEEKNKKAIILDRPEFSEINTINDCDKLFYNDTNGNNLFYYQNCYITMALKAKDISYCNMMISPYYLGDCYKEFSKESGKDMCNSLKMINSKAKCKGYFPFRLV
jgi:peroxiredoxin family protein